MTCSARVIDLARTADMILHRLLAIRPQEELLLVVDTESNLEMAYSLAAAAARIGCEYSIAMMPSRRGNPEKSNQLPKSVAAAFTGADVAIGLTRASFAPLWPISRPNWSLSKKSCAITPWPCGTLSA
jgi:hypothetical protein